MKKTIFIFLIMIMIFPSIVLANELDLTKGATSAVLIDYHNGNILYNKNANQKTSVASLTKMMGLLLIFESIDQGKLKTNEILTTSKTAKEMGGTQIWLEEGEKISVNDLLKGITMASANDAMVLMAERLSGTEEAFVSEMNKKAQELNLKNTKYINCTGLDEKGAYSSAYDQAIIAKELIKHKKILEYTSKYEDYIRNNKNWIVNTNKLVKFYQGVDGLKTGYTDEAGSTIAVTSLKDNLRLIGVSLGYQNPNTRNNETMNLLDYGYNQYESKVLIKKDNKLKTITQNKANNKIDIYLKEDLIVLIKKGDKESNYTYKIKIKEIKYPVKKNTEIGTLILIQNNKIIQTVPIITKETIKKASFLKQYLKTINNILSGTS